MIPEKKLYPRIMAPQNREELALGVADFPKNTFHSARFFIIPAPYHSISSTDTGAGFFTIFRTLALLSQ